MGKPRRSLASSNLGTAPRIERKIIEKNRRTKMKSLYSQLTSLLPQNNSNSNSKVEGAPLPDQIDEAVKHITDMKMRLEKLRQKKEFILRRNQPNNSCITNNDRVQPSNPASASPVIEVHDMGQNIDVIVANGLQNYSTFRHIVRLVHQNGAEIASASFARDGNSSVQVLHDKVGQPKPGFDGEMISKRLKELVGEGASSSSEVVESELDLWDYEIDSNINWGFEIPEVLLPGVQEFMINMKKS